MRLEGFTRVPDPIHAEQLAEDINVAIGRPVFVEITPTQAIVEGDVSEADRTAIQTVIDNYEYESTAAPMLDVQTTGAGAPIYKQVVGNTIVFRSVNALSNRVVMGDNPNEIAVDVHADNTVAASNDPRLSDDRNPLPHTHDYAATDHTHPAPAELPTPGQKNALSGTNGTPGVNNKYVTETDSRLTDTRTPTAHTHAISDTTNLQTSLDGKAATSHTHTKSQVTDFAHTHPASELTATGTRDNTTFLRGDNTWATPAGGGGTNQWTRVVLASDVLNSQAVANTIMDIAGLSFSVTAGTRYWFKFHIFYTAALTTTGSRWSINGPASPTGLNYTSEYSLTATTTTRNANLIGYDLPAASNASSASTGPSNRAIIEGFIQPSANGTVIARFASEIAASLITAKAGSFVDYAVT